MIVPKVLRAGEYCNRTDAMYMEAGVEHGANPRFIV
jgi:hypothetical protein